MCPILRRRRAERSGASRVAPGLPLPTAADLDPDDRAAQRTGGRLGTDLGPLGPAVDAVVRRRNEVLIAMDE